MTNAKSKFKALSMFLLVLLLMLPVLQVTGCEETSAEVRATLDGQTWEGPIEYNFGSKEMGCGATLGGAENSVTAYYSCFPGDYVTRYNSGGPEGAQFSGIGYVKYCNVGVSKLDRFVPSSRMEFNLQESDMPVIYFVFITTGEITVDATLDGAPWEGPVSYTIEGPETESGSTVPQSFTEVPVGTYTVTYNSGGPPDAELMSISPSATEELSTGDTTKFILNFVSSAGEITVNATLDDQPWEGPVSYTIEGPDTELGSTVPQTFTELPIGTYTATYDSGGPPGAVLKEISPSATEELSTGETAAFTLVFVSTDGITDGITDGTTDEVTGEIMVKAILNGIPWEGPVNYTIEGPKAELGSLAPQTFAEIPVGTYTVTYKSGGPQSASFAGIYISNIGEIAAGETTTFLLIFDPLSYIGGAVAQSADLSLTKTADYPFRPQGEDITYTITVANNGPDAATNIVVTDNLPAGVNYVNDNPSQGAYNNVTGIWNVGTIAVGGNATLQITATVAAGSGTVVTNTAEVTSVGQGDPDSTPGNSILAEDDQDTAAFTVT